MNNTQDHRVLSRLGARELSPDEYQQVTGGIITAVMTRLPAPDMHADG
jgi:hypothetical protein